MGGKQWLFLSHIDFSLCLSLSLSKINKHIKNKTHRYREQMGGCHRGEKGEGIKKYKLVVTKQSQECKVWDRGYSQ